MSKRPRGLDVRSTIYKARIFKVLPPAGASKKTHRRKRCDSDLLSGLYKSAIVGGRKNNPRL